MDHSAPAASRRLGSLGSGTDRLRGRGRGRGARKFAPTIAPRRIPPTPAPGSAKQAVPKLLEVAQRPEVEERRSVRPKRQQVVGSGSTVTFVAGEAKKLSFVPNDRFLRTSTAISCSSTPSECSAHNDEMEADDASGDALSSFTPLTLPLSLSRGDSTETDDLISSVGVKTEPSKNTSKAPTSAKEVLEQALRAGQSKPDFMFWQLPCRLPTLKTAADPPPSRPAVKTEKGAPSNDASNKSIEAEKLDEIGQIYASSATKIPAGFLGKLVIYKSGKVVLKCGDVDFIVNLGMQCPYRQELLAMNLQASSCNRLSSVNTRIMCSPDLSTLDHQVFSEKCSL